VSVNFIDQQGKSILKIDDPVEQIGGTVLYKSKLKSNPKGELKIKGR